MSSANVSDDHFYATQWEILRDAINMLLVQPSASYRRVSYEQTYSAVYKCVCKQYSEQLFGDLKEVLHKQLVIWRSELDVCASDYEVVHEFHRILTQYFVTLANVVPIFTYLNRIYVEPRLQTTINAEMLALFRETISDDIMPRLIGILESPSVDISPAVMQLLVQNIHSLDKKYVNLCPKLFADFIVGIRPSMTVDDLEAQREADYRSQEALRRSGFGSGDRTKKRSLSTDTGNQVPENH